MGKHTNIGDLLHEYDRTQSEFATLVGSRSHASEYLSGKRSVPLSVRIMLHKQWNFNASKLLDLERRCTDA